MAPRPALRRVFQEAIVLAGSRAACVRTAAATVPTPVSSAHLPSRRLSSSHSSSPFRLRPTASAWSTNRLVAAPATLSRQTQSYSTTTTSSASEDPAAAAAAAPPNLPASILPQVLHAASFSAADAAATRHPSVYATVHIYGRPYLVTPGDSLRLPFRMPGVQPGDELLLDRVGVVGSRTVTAVGNAAPGQAASGEAEVRHIPGASVRAVVLGVETEPLRVLIKKKRRNRRKRSVRSKHQFTVLRIQEVTVGGGEEAA